MVRDGPGPTLTAFGDIQIDADTAGIRKSDAIRMLRRSQLTAGDMEMILSRTSRPAYTGILLKSDPKIAALLRAMNCQVLSIANNKVYDCGEEGLADTIGAASAEGLLTVGAGRSIEEAKRGASVTVNGLKISFLGFTCVFPAESRAFPNKPGVFCVGVESTWRPPRYYELTPTVVTRVAERDLEAVKERVSEMAKETDCLVVMAHWGDVARHELSDYQVELGHDLVDEGADLVLGSHPHVIQAAERYRGKLILYGLGNFIFQRDLKMDRHKPALWEKWVRQSILARVPLRRKTIPSARVYPVIQDGDGTPSLAAGRDAEYILETMEHLSKREGTPFKIERSGRFGLV